MQPSPSMILAVALGVSLPILAVTGWSNWYETWPARFFMELQMIGGGSYGQKLTFLVTMLSLFGVPAVPAFLWLGAQSFVLARRVPIPDAWRGIARGRRVRFVVAGSGLLGGALVFGGVGVIAPEWFSGREWGVVAGMLVFAFGWMGPFFVLEGALPPIHRVSEVRELRTRTVPDERRVHDVVLEDGVVVVVEREVYESLARGDRIAVLISPMMRASLKLERLG